MSAPQQPQPGQQSGPPGGGRRPGNQFMPVLIMLGLIVGLIVIYSGIRAARQSLEPEAKNHIALPQNMGKIQVGLPQGWHKALMQGVAGASGRWGMGKPGSTRYAMFITRYPLRLAPQDKEQTAQVIREAQSSLLQTGAPRNGLKPQEKKIVDHTGWYYQFQTSGMGVQIWLLLHQAKKQASLYQFSCQSPVGKNGDAMRRGCQEVLNGLKFSEIS